MIELANWVDVRGWLASITQLIVRGHGAGVFVSLLCVSIAIALRHARLASAERQRDIGRKVARMVRSGDGLEVAVAAALHARGAIARTLASGLVASVPGLGQVESSFAAARARTARSLLGGTSQFEALATLSLYVGVLAIALAFVERWFTPFERCDFVDVRIVWIVLLWDALPFTAAAIVVSAVTLLADAYFTARTARLVAHLDVSIAEVVTALRETRGLRFHGAPIRVPAAYREG